MPLCLPISGDGAASMCAAVRMQRDGDLLVFDAPVATNAKHVGHQLGQKLVLIR